MNLESRPTHKPLEFSSHIITCRSVSFLSWFEPQSNSMKVVTLKPVQTVGEI